MSRNYSRRAFLSTSAGFLAAPGLLFASRPKVTHGVASGDVSHDSAVIWSRSDKPARMVVEWSTTESFQNHRRVLGPVTNASDDFTAKLVLSRLPSGQRIFYRVSFEDRGGQRTVSEAHMGQFLTASRDQRDVMFAWSGDTCGQGYGIDVSRGGLLSYAGLRKLRPDFFVHSGDTIYGDGPLAAEKKLPDGSIWKNLITPEKAKVAETLAEFRGNHRYNLLDEHVRQFNSEVAIFGQWDDHEVRNNWFPSQILDDTRYTIKDVDTLARNGRQAFLDYWPIRPGRIYRKISRGPLCDIFFLDMRSYRGPNTPNRQSQRSRETEFLGAAQIAWLKRSLRSSKAVWKVIASDMPIGLIVGDGKNFENCANGNGPALGRELEIADLLSFMQREGVQNTLWLTADVHYAASNFYSPARAKFTDFNPFWEFVSGPLHAASLAPGSLDNTFGTEMRFSSRPKGSKESGPYTKEQFFSTVAIEGRNARATVTHYNRDAEKLWSINLQPVMGKR